MGVTYECKTSSNYCSSRYVCHWLRIHYKEFDLGIYQSDISKEEMEYTTYSYMQQGYDEEEAKSKAKEYLMEREELYQKAVDAGYSVTDEEVEEYLDSLKELIYSSEDGEEQLAISMNYFENEDEYWDYEFLVYQKNLVIQKYNKDMDN